MTTVTSERLSDPELPAPQSTIPLLGGERSAVALIDGDRRLTFGEVGDLVTARVAQLGARRRVQLLEMRNDVASVVDLLAALTAQHPLVLLPPGDHLRQAEIAERYAGATELHPDLAVLLSTSGSTGSPKLVRLSLANLTANAHSIATYLRLGPDDRGITSLPMHYCYGLSVLTSHLVSGAAVVLTDLSVADDCFWDLANASRITGFAGVPYTFDLLQSSGFAAREVAGLRYVTQAGGRLDPEMVRHFATLGADRGFDLFVMYGQTEATARMAYLPPHLATERPTAVGVPVPGGHFRLAPVPDAPAGVGELVYAGPNVMMGYAEQASDLARGPELTELHTGDLARRGEDGLWEICGRIDRFAKVFGLRLDLARLEADLQCPATLVTLGDGLHAFVPDTAGDTTQGSAGADADDVHAALRAATTLPPGAIQVHRVDTIPLNAKGRPDLAALRRLGEDKARARHAAGTGRDRDAHDAETLLALYAVVLGRADATPEDTFVSLGGDSLSFVEISTQLAHRLGHLPAGWQHMCPRELSATARPRSRWWTSTEPSVVLRALAILAIVVSHTDLFLVMGGAHVLLAVAGFNLSRFALSAERRSARVRRVLATTAAFAVPASLWMLVVGSLNGDYRPWTALYLNQALGGETWSPDWQFWFLEALVWIYLGLAALLCVPVIDRWQQARPFTAALSATVAMLGVRFAVTGQGTDGLQEYSILVVAWCVTLGWTASRAHTTVQRVVVAVLVLIAAWGFFPGQPERCVVVVVGMSCLLWTRPLRLPRPVLYLLSPIAAASFWIYLTHWQVYPRLEAAGLPVVAVLASVAVGVLMHRGQDLVSHAWRRIGSVNS